MNYTTLSKLELADRFDSAAKDLHAFIKKNNLKNTIVDMNVGDDKRCAETPLNKTPACHGGWGAIMYPEGFVDFKQYGDISSSWFKNGEPFKFYRVGAEILANKLGFKTNEDYKCWADNYPEIWGCEHGYGMFTSAVAFNSRQGMLKLSHIADWYEDVARRLREF